MRGRDFTPEEIADPGDVMLVNQALAARYWPGGDPIGKRITVYKSAQGRPEFGQPVRATIIGVVGNVRHFSLDTDFAPEVYLPYTLTVWPRMAVLARTAGDPESLIPTLTRAVRAVDPDIPWRARGLDAGCTISAPRSASRWRTAGSSPDCWRRSRCPRCCWRRSGSTAWSRTW